MKQHLNGHGRLDRVVIQPIHRHGMVRRSRPRHRLDAFQIKPPQHGDMVEHSGKLGAVRFKLRFAEAEPGKLGYMSNFVHG